jgi:hypothetical protein
VERLKRRDAAVLFLNVPFPNLDFLRAYEKGFTPDEEARLIEVIRLFNEFLRDEATRLDCPVVDVYRLSAGLDGVSPGRFHIDGYHLSPDALALAFE